MLRFYLSKNRQKVLLQPTAALPGSILSLQEVVTLFWKRRPIIFRRTRLMLLLIGALLHLRLCSRDVTKISSSSQLKVPHQRWHSSLTYNDGYWMVAELFNKWAIGKLRNWARNWGCGWTWIGPAVGKVGGSGQSLLGERRRRGGVGEERGVNPVPSPNHPPWRGFLGVAHHRWHQPEAPNQVFFLHMGKVSWQCNNGGNHKCNSEHYIKRCRRHNRLEGSVLSAK